MHVLFGSIFGLSAGQAWLAAGIALGVIAALVAIARPLVFASLDRAAAEALGVPVRLLGVLCLCLVGVTAAEATQAVGALLLLGLLAAPAGAAHRLTTSPFRGMALSGALAVVALWIGLVLAYEIPSVPPSSAIIGVAAGLYLAAAAANRRPRGARARVLA